jgi:hypothetical protein
MRATSSRLTRHSQAPAWDEDQASGSARSAPASLLHPRKRSSAALAFEFHATGRSRPSRSGLSLSRDSGTRLSASTARVGERSWRDPDSSHADTTSPCAATLVGFRTSFRTLRTTVARCRSKRQGESETKPAILQALRPMARPGLEPGTPRFSGSRGGAIPLTKDLQNHGCQSDAAWRDGVGSGRFRVGLGLRRGLGVPMGLAAPANGWTRPTLCRLSSRHRRDSTPTTRIDDARPGPRPEATSVELSLCDARVPDVRLSRA